MKGVKKVGFGFLLLLFYEAIMTTMTINMNTFFFSFLVSAVYRDTRQQLVEI